MENVLFNYVVDGVVVEELIPYKIVLERTGLKDTVGLIELGYIEHIPPAEHITLNKEQLGIAIRGMRNFHLQQSDWTQLADAPLDGASKALWAAYRQELRDLPAVYADVESIAIGDIVIPTPPNAPAV